MLIRILLSNEITHITSKKAFEFSCHANDSNICVCVWMREPGISEVLNSTLSLNMWTDDGGYERKWNWKRLKLREIDVICSTIWSGQRNKNGTANMAGECREKWASDWKKRIWHKEWYKKKAYTRNFPTKQNERGGKSTIQEKRIRWTPKEKEEKKIKEMDSNEAEIDRKWLQASELERERHRDLCSHQHKNHTDFDLSIWM